MDNCIKIEGIATNNLKDISVSLEKRAINLIIGPSGSGKSSLAYDTIAQIGQHEYTSLYADNATEPSYAVQKYSNMVATVPIKQTNHNTNMHSTIGTYFGFNRKIAYLYAVLTGEKESFFTLNKVANLCETCHGLGIIRALDENRIIDYSLPLSENPIRCWNKYKDFYKQIISQYCDEVGIDADKTFRQLTSREKKEILYGVGDFKYSVKYKKTGRLSSRTTKYYGVFSGHAMMPKCSPSDQFYADICCPQCQGKKYSPEHNNYTINNLSIGDFMTAPFTQLRDALEKLAKQHKDKRIFLSIKSIQQFIEKAIDLKLGHLSFHRAIPTLSGGELQRLKLVQVFNSQLTDLLIVLDEPLAGLSGVEKKAIYDNILSLAKKHTVLVVDHSDIFVKDAKKIYALGPGSGNKGGTLIDPIKYLQSESVNREYFISETTELIRVDISNQVYHYHGAKLTVSRNALNLITGTSGVGKSTLLREYFPQQFDEYIYVDQKPIGGSKNSSVATALDIAGRIAEVFAKSTGKDKKVFSNHTGNEGMCPTCGGGGFIEYGYDNRTKIQLVCEDCEGTGFNRALRKYRINGKTIFDVWKMTIDEAAEFFVKLDPKIFETLQEASSIMLGHLQIGQATSSLSGGENIRIKLLQTSKTKKQIVGIDEPFRGLGKSEIYKVSLYLDRLRQKGKTIVVIDHSDYAERFFACKINLKNDGGVLVDE